MFYIKIKGGGKVKITLKAARINSNLKQMEVAKLIGVHFQTYRNWEIGKTKPDYEQLRKLAELFEIKIENIK